MIPENLDGWTLEHIATLLRQGVFESDRFDFKEKLPSREPGGALRLRKACAALANANGGFLIFGVKDDKGLTPEDRLVGVASSDDFPANFGNFPAAAEPSVEWSLRNPPLPLTAGRAIHIVHVPASARKPHAVLDDGRWWFCKRTAKGTEAMSYEEVRDAFGDAERRRGELAWLRAELDRLRDLAHRMNIDASWDHNRLEMLFTRFDASQMRTVLLPVFGYIGGDTMLVGMIQDVAERCMRLDAALAPLAAHAILPRDRSFAGTTDPRELIRAEVPQIAMTAARAMEQLDRLLR